VTPPDERRALPGSLGRALLFVLLYLSALFVALGLFGSVLTSLVAATGQRIRVDEILNLVAAIGATALMVRAVDVRPWADVGLGSAAARPASFAWGSGVGAAPIAAASGMLLAVGWLQVMPAQPGSSLGAALRITIVLLPAALHEEVVCRGYLLTALRDSIGVRGAVIATSVLFGLLHVPNAGSTAESVGIVILAGIFLAAVRVVFDSLYAAWAAHAAWNWIMAVPLHAPVSGLQFEAPDYRTVSTGPGWITGGAWGPEGGLAAALGMVAMLAFLHSRRRREES
jgi:uncharacterized protein